MTCKQIIAAFLLFACTLTIMAQDQTYPTQLIDGKEFYIYHVGSGEGFYSICRKFKVSQADVLQYNPAAAHGLKGGQELRIPVVNPTSPVADKEISSEKWFSHTVTPGETLYAIANMYNVNIDSIVALNPDSDKNIKAGFILKIPQGRNTGKTEGTTSKAGYVYHTIAPKETLFSLAKRFGTDIESIIQENPGLTASNFAIGKVVRVLPGNGAVQEAPKMKEVIRYQDYTVLKKESLFSISQKMGIPIKEIIAANPGLKKVVAGDVIKIPLKEKTEIKTAESTETERQDVINEVFTKLKSSKKKNVLNIAVMLPFMLKQGNDKNAPLYIEYYEGFLLAVDSMKKQGVSMNVYAYDTENSEGQINSILANKDMKNMDLIIGPTTDRQIKIVSDFALENKINMINMFSLKNEEVLHNARIFQTNVPHPYLYAETAHEFCDRFKNRSVIFVSDDNKSSKKEFIDVLQSDLRRQSIPFKGTILTESGAGLEVLLSDGKPAVIVPESGSFESLSKLLPVLRQIREKNPQQTVSLFGYPEWQTYSKDFIDSFYALDTYIFTRFYTNPTSRQTKEFYKKYKYWFSKELHAANPQYGILGFDTGMFFLEALSEYGKDFQNNIDRVNTKSIQTDFYFQRVNNWSGFINKGIYFVNFRPDFTIQKIEVR